jgi:hypothetical protein
MLSPGAPALVGARSPLAESRHCELAPPRPLTRPLPRQPHRDCRGGEMADAEDSKSSVRKHMRVQVPPSAPEVL